MKKKFTVIATGDTFRVKHSLKEWDFGWDRDAKHWIAIHVDEATVNMFKGWARGAEWEGVELAVTEEPAPFDGPRYTLDQQIRNEREEK